MKELGLFSTDFAQCLSLDEWEVNRECVVLNRRLGEGAFGTVFGGEAFLDPQGWVAVAVKTLKIGSTMEEKVKHLCLKGIVVVNYSHCYNHLISTYI